MNKHFITKRISVFAIVLSLWAVPVAAVAQQTRITAPKNKYKVQDDVQLGSQAAREVEQQFPLIQDGDAAEYLQQVGRRLVDAIPNEFDQPAFNYQFKWVNASDLNAFALPGGPMYVNRGMLESARNEGELAGVMAHEISHVALRHATAQATKQSSAKNTLGTLGLILGGAILGGQTGAQLGALGASVIQTKYSREYETQADTLGARIMADAGYDPRDLANVFQTIAQQSRSGAPEWLSSHPDPGNRYEKINREAQFLRVSANPTKITREFERIQSRFRSMPRARSMSEISQQGSSNNGASQVPTAGGRYSRTVPAPSTRSRYYNGPNGLRLSIPDNWRDFSSNNGATFAPEGAYGDQGITHGMMIGIEQVQGMNLQQASEAYVRNVLQGNSYLRQQTGFSSRSIDRRQGYATQLAGVSPVTGRTEIVNVYTTSTPDGQFFYAVTVMPQNDGARYNSAFSNILYSIQFGNR
jgi:Zn-dependent protease with chaperone function